MRRRKGGRLKRRDSPGQYEKGSQKRKEDKGEKSIVGKLTHARNNLRLHAVLVLKPAREVAYAAAPIACHVRHFPYMIEHVSAREQQDHDQADAGPEVSILDDRGDVRPRDGDECKQAEQDRDAGADACVVDRAHDRGIGNGGVRGQAAQQPRVHGVGGLRA